ncbi:type IX secretion system membrane protein PorP/SprF, partial [Myroides sp. NP-2]|uniref:PorP/SprF family type IX secretion system membrane protein n=1 Tax=Myroides sp. NP-2 TaxID=2759945 RepID=UPI0015F7D414
NSEYKLAFGLKGSGNLLNVDYSKLSIYEQSDPIVANNVENAFGGNLGVGMFLYSEKAYVGVSAPNLFTQTRYDDNAVNTLAQRMHLYVTGGYVFDLSYNLKLKPAAMVKMVEGSPLQVDLSANVMFRDKFTFGAAYRWDAAVSGLVGFQVTDNMMIGYSYDAETSKLSRYNSGSHEIFLRFNLLNSFKRVTAPRFF